MMKKSIFLSLILLIIAVWGYSQNLVVNGDLESWSAGEPDAWDKFENIEQESTTVHGGSYSAKHTSAEASMDLAQEISGVQGGLEYTISYWYYDNDPAARTRIWAYWLNGGSYLDDDEDVLRADNFSTDIDAWQEFNVTLIAPINADGFKFEVRVYHQDNNTGGAVYYDDFVLSGDATIYDEPTNYPTNFSASAEGTSINLSWTDATGAQLPIAYVIYAGANETLPTPTDGTVVDNDTDLSDGSGALNVSYGTGTATFNGLSENTPYYFSIYSYTNAGINVDFKNDGTAPTASATTGTNPYLLEQTFENGFGDWQTISVIGNNEWFINETYGNPAPCGNMNGYEGGPVPNEDWLISPAFNLDNTENEVLTFSTATNYDGPVLQLFFSNDYSGTGDPNSANWENISFNLPEQGWDWYESGNIDFSGYSGTNAYIAFKYTSNNSGAANYELDEIILDGENLSINENAFAKEIKIFPNPSNGLLNVVNNNLFPVKTTIYNIAGEMIFYTIVNQNTQVLDLNDLSEGIYFVRFLNPENNNTTIQKLIIQ